MRHSHHDYIVDELFPAREIHVVGGPSGSGKTTWMFQMMEDWIAGKPIHGYKSHPCDWFYVSCDRSLAGVHRTIDRMQVHLDTNRMASLVDNHEGIGLTSPKTFILSIKKYLPNGGVLFVDGLAILAAMVPVGKDNNYGAISSFLVELARECMKHNITIIGTAHSPKTKENERILNPRQKVLGSVAWAGCAETIVIIEPNDDSDIDNHVRTLLILPRNIAPIHMELAFNEDGRLAELVDASATVLNIWLKKLPDGQIISTAEVVAFGETKGIIRRSCERWLKQAKEDGRLTPGSKKGLYIKSFTT